MREGFRVVGPDGKMMPERFREIRRNKSLVEVEAMGSGGHAMVHCTRIISDKKEAAMATKKVGGSPKFDFKTIAGERWSKPMAFDHKGVKAEAHVVVNRITKKYRAFNTYNGSLGKQGKTGSVFAFKDYAQLTARLADRGYKRIGGSPTASPKAKAKPAKTTTVRVVAKPKITATKPTLSAPKAAPADLAAAPKEVPSAIVPSATPIPPVQP